MKKIFTLFAVILMTVCASAQELAGYYTSTYKWIDAWGDEAGPNTAIVSLHCGDGTNVQIHNFANMGGTVTGVYNAAQNTITFTGQEINGYKLCTYPDLEAEVVATIADGVISFANVGVGSQDEEKIDWYYRDLSSSMKMLNPTASVPATYVLGEGANVKGATTVYFYSIEDCDYDFGFELAGQLVLVYNDGEDLEVTNDVIEGINPAEEYSKLELTASNWWSGDKYWTLSGNNEKGTLTLKGEYYTESGWFADAIEEGTFTLTWGTTEPSPAIDLVGNYVSSYSWIDAWGDAAGPNTAIVSIKVDEAGNVLLGNFANMGGTVTGVYNAAQNTITFTGQEVSGYKLCTYPDLEAEVVATIADGVISFANVGLGSQGEEKIDWYYRDLSSSMKMLNPVSSVPAVYCLGDGANIKGETTIYYYSIEDCDYDFGFELGEDLVLVYNDGDDLELTNDVILNIKPELEYSKLELYASNWWGDKFWTLSGNSESGVLTLKGEFYTEDGWFADAVEEGTFTLAWGDAAVGISSAKAQAKASAIYNLAGQRVAKAAKGIYIKDGKKIVLTK